MTRPLTITVDDDKIREVLNLAWLGLGYMASRDETKARAKKAVREVQAEVSSARVGYPGSHDG